MAEQESVRLEPLATLGDPSAPIWVVCEPPQKTYNPVNPTTTSSLHLFVNEAKAAGFQGKDFYFIQLCPPIPDEIKASKAKTWKFVEPYATQMRERLQTNNKPVVTMGDLATRTALGRAAAITKVRGTLQDGRVYPILSPAMCRIALERLPEFKADMTTLRTLHENNYDLNKLGNNDKLNRYWCQDIQHIIDMKPQIISVDTETTGLDVTDPNFRVLTVQIGYSDTDCAVIPLCPEFWQGKYNQADRDYLLAQVKTILEDQKVMKVGQNINYERHALDTLDITLRGVLGECQVMAWCVDENMLTKTLDDLVRRFVPHLAGLNDQLNVEIDKTSMATQDPAKVLMYAGNDGIMTYQLFKVLWGIMQQDRRQLNLYLKVKLPGLHGFYTMEKMGVEVDQEYLAQLGEELTVDIDAMKQSLLQRVPRAVIRKHLEEKKELSFSRGDFVRDILFSPLGFNLKPVVYTKSTKDGPDEDKIPSTSAKDHLPYFADHPVHGDFVSDLMEYQKLAKLSSTYVHGFVEKYVRHDGCIHPKFNLHITVTGRSSSSGPNAQNFPSRGPYAKKYKRMLKAREGYKFISADLSQIELRLIAWESQDPVMLQVYRDDRDIHTLTAQAVTGINGDAWDALSKSDKKDFRTRAKAVNFGFCYGMQWRKFKRFAKTDYKVDLTDQEAEHYYNTYHRLYANIKKWHHDRTYEASKYGQVIALHGAVRHVPSVYSDDAFLKSQAERQAINSPIQSVGSDLGVLAIARIARQVDLNIIRPVMFIHDDIILEVKDGHELEAVNMLLWVLNNPPFKQLFGVEPPIPIKAEPDIGTNLGDMYALYELEDSDPEEYHEIARNINPQKPSWWDDSKDIK